MVFYCASDNRRDAVREARDANDSPFVNGIDYVEVTSTDQTELTVHFVHPLPGETGGVPANPVLGTDNIRIERDPPYQGRNNIVVTGVTANDQTLTLTVAEPGDFAYYRLVITAGADVLHVPAGFDSQLAQVSFSFKAACPDDLDCKATLLCDEDTTPAIRLDYRARDFASLNRVLIERMQTQMPQWQSESPVDFSRALIELFAYVGDQYSYKQDWLATESYLDRARHRVSVQRHARLRNYFMHHGCNARAWLQVDAISGGFTVPSGTATVAGSANQHTLARRAGIAALDPDQSVVFETMLPCAVHADHNRLPFYTWSETECVLCQGATSVTLVAPATPLQTDTYLLFEQIKDPDIADDVERAALYVDRRWVVRIASVENETDLVTGTEVVRVGWDQQDALPFALCLSNRHEGTLITDICIARGNVVLADHGASFSESVTKLTDNAGEDDTDAMLSQRQVSSEVVFRPYIKTGPVARIAPLHNLNGAIARVQEPSQAIAQVALTSSDGNWQPTRDILATGRNTRVFVAEVDDGGQTCLRFGDSEHGLQPTIGQRFVVSGRIGNGVAGNVGPETLTTMLLAGAPIAQVRNPLPATGGHDPESVASVKRFAPVAFKRQQRAVTLLDYVDRAREFPGVQDAFATFRHMASWYTVVIAIDRFDGLPLTPEFTAEFLDHMERFRLMGYDLDVREPLRVPLDIELRICSSPQADRSELVACLEQEYGSQRGGLFHPDNFRFGHILYASTLVNRAVKTPGVQEAVLLRFQRFGQPAAGELADGRITAAPNEILELLNDASAPGRGRFRLTFGAVAIGVT